MMDKDTKLLLATLYCLISITALIVIGWVIFELPSGYPERFMDLLFQSIIICISGFIFLVALFVVDEYKNKGD